MKGQTAIILAAGQGTRMKSERPKVLHALAGRPMVDYVIEAALTAGCHDVVVVVGSGREQVTAHLGNAFGSRVRTAVQQEQLGTGHAVGCALPLVEADVALLLYGDTPLVRHEDLAALLAAGGDLAMLTCIVDDPTGYGRILRNSAGAIVGVREDRDCDADMLAIHEINPGMYATRVEVLRNALAQLRPHNAQGELYLTDVVALVAAKGAIADRRADAATLAGINDRAQLARAEEAMHARIAERWQRAGATIHATARIDALVSVEPDALVGPGVVLRGTTRIGSGARVDVGSVLEDTVVERGAYIKPYTVCLQSTVGQDAQVGPFAHLRPESRIDERAHVGNFVETKKTHLRRGAKANHLAYLGDGDIGEDANVGAGTIFCNYDGFQKHRTVIGARAFIGSDSQLIAPIQVGEDAYVATGTTVTKDVPPDALAVGRARQENKAGYASRLRARLRAAAKRK